MNNWQEPVAALTQLWLTPGALVAVLALVLGLTVRQLLSRQYQRARTGLRDRLGHELFAIVVPYSGLLTSLSAAYVLCLSLDWDDRVSSLFFQLVLALAVIRVAALLVRLGLTRNRRSKVWAQAHF